jgi:hypothetical protein
MPKEEIDYSNTIIYKIFCKVKSITDVYVGHTTNFTQRKYAHKLACNSSTNKLKIYNKIRQTGGWDNWDMIEIAKYNCKDHTDARIKEQEHFEQLTCNLNSKTLYVNNKYNCNICNIKYNSELEYNYHHSSNEHKIKLASLDKKDNIKSSKKYICSDCDYNTSRYSQYLRHLETDKHKKITLSSSKFIKEVQHSFSCECGNMYLYKSGLCKHKKKCEYNKKAYSKYFKNTEELIEAVVKDNQEFKQMLIDQNNKIMELASSKNTTVITNNTTNNSNSNHFNLQMFLNVECKDALNINEFVDSLQPNIKDLEATGRLGYVEGISKIFLNGLENLDINKRSIHCSDQKREIIYIKDNNVWEKETDNRDKLKLAIKKIALKNIKQISIWQKENPDCFDSSSKKNDQYLKIVSNSMNGLTPEETQKNYNKIISNLVKEVVIQKK